ncbi:disulfide bond formation protein B [Teredinibacter franksiae]|uniref:disulfide bond formation protein B n=1 Tax=Teredinibacter franksiae TaxID=2761453 RepID=UPI001FE8FCF2|nr:disulfide bond formation protein B [Teredinibacter franksiae]
MKKSIVPSAEHFVVHYKKLHSMCTSIRGINLLIVLVSTGAVLIAVLFFQKVLHLTPCPLCVTQRVFVMAVGLLALLAFIHAPKKRGGRIYAGLGAVVALSGGAISLRHLWLQSLPDHLVPACGSGIAYLFQTLPLMDALKVILQGDGDCAEVVWSLWGISIPGWTLVSFIAFALINAWQFTRPMPAKILL